jgi:hypothetical protein
MEQYWATVKIIGQPVIVVLTDEPKLLGSTKRKPSNGRYCVLENKIWIDINMSWPMRRVTLFHEVYEYVLGYLGMFLNPQNQHDGFMRFSYLLWGVFTENAEVLCINEGDLKDELERLRTKGEPETTS